MAYNPKDFYFKKAKEKNFVARSVFKLEEIDQRFKIFSKGDRVLDLGCAPGSWTQYASKIIGRQGLCIGIDLQKVNLTLHNAVFYSEDLREKEKIRQLIQTHGVESFDVILSDMAPKTTGIRLQDQQRSYELCQLALDLARSFLKKDGKFVVKFFQSEFFDAFLKEMKDAFLKVELLRPKSTRKASYEIYLIGLHKK